MVDGGRTRYLLWDRLGRGASGEVFRGIGFATNRWHAIKVVSREVGAREAAAQSLLPYTMENRTEPHRNLVYLDDAFTLGDRFYLVMELCDCSLERFIAGVPYKGEDWLYPIAADVLNGLAQIHLGGAVHADLHRRNVLLIWRPPDERPTFKISDLGQRKRWVDLEGRESPDMITLDIRAAGALLTEVALGDYLYSSAEGHLDKLPRLVASTLRDAMAGSFNGPDAATRLLEAIDDACLVSGWSAG